MLVKATASTAIIYGGARKGGNTRKVADAVAQTLSADIFDVSDYKISFYDHEHKNINDDFLPLINRLLEYKNWIFASPVYWYTMSAQLKVFIDRLSDLLDVEPVTNEKLSGLSAALIATGLEEDCPLCYEDVFINTFNDLGMNYQGCLYINASNSIDQTLLDTKLQLFVASLPS